MRRRATTSVSIEAAPASFVVASKTQITVVVPNGANTGKIRVATPGGKATSPDYFRVVN